MKYLIYKTKIVEVTNYYSRNEFTFLVEGLEFHYDFKTGITVSDTKYITYLPSEYTTLTGFTTDNVDRSQNKEWILFGHDIAMHISDYPCRSAVPLYTWGEIRASQGDKIELKKLESLIVRYQDIIQRAKLQANLRDKHRNQA